MAGDDGVVRYERTGPIARITFDRPAARNAMSWPMYEQLRDCLDRIDADPDVRVARLAGANHTFVAGTDIAQFAEFRSADDGVAYERRLDEIIGRLDTVRVPTLAVIDGVAAGGGLVMAAACDIRICTAEARFGAPIARSVGNCLSLSSTARLIALLGPARVKAMLLLADFMGAEEALASGFVADVVDREQITARADELCERIAANAPITLHTVREAVRRILDVSGRQGDDLVRLAYGSADFREGVRAFLEKRDPRWEGR